MTGRALRARSHPLFPRRGDVSALTDDDRFCNRIADASSDLFLLWLMSQVETTRPCAGEVVKGCSGSNLAAAAGLNSILLSGLKETVV